MALRPDRPQSRAEQLAARDAAQTAAFAREVDDALREDEVLGAIRRHARPVGAALVLGLSALAGGIWWNNHRAAVAAEHAERFVLALDRIDAGEQDAAFTQLGTLARDAHDGSGTAAKLLQAAIAARKGNAGTAASLYDAVAADGDAPRPYRDLATLRGTALRFDTLKPADVVARLKPLAAPGNPWFGSAGELLAAAYLAQGQKDLAGPLLVAIARDKQTPDSLRARTRQLAGVLGFDSLDDIARTTPAPAAAPPQGMPPAGAVPMAGPQPQTGPAPVPPPASAGPRRLAPVDAGAISVHLPAVQAPPPASVPAPAAAAPTPAAPATAPLSGAAAPASPAKP